MTGIVHSLGFLNDFFEEHGNTKKILLNALIGGGMGYVSLKFAKTFSYVVGIAIIIMELSNSQGFIDFDWNLYLLQFESKHNLPYNIRAFLQKWNERGFYAGFLIGASMS